MCDLGKTGNAKQLGTWSTQLGGQELTVAERITWAPWLAGQLPSMQLFCSPPSIEKIHTLKMEPCPHGSCIPGHHHLANSCLQDGIKAALGGIQVARDALFPELLAEVVDVVGQADDILEGEGGVSIVPGLAQPRTEGESWVFVWGRSKGTPGCKLQADKRWGEHPEARESLKGRHKVQLASHQH